MRDPQNYLGKNSIYLFKLTVKLITNYGTRMNLMKTTLMTNCPAPHYQCRGINNREVHWKFKELLNQSLFPVQKRFQKLRQKFLRSRRQRLSLIFSKILWTLQFVWTARILLPTWYGPIREVQKAQRSLTRRNRFWTYNPWPSAEDDYPILILNKTRELQKKIFITILYVMKCDL